MCCDVVLCDVAISMLMSCADCVRLFDVCCLDLHIVTRVCARLCFVSRLGCAMIE